MRRYWVLALAVIALLGMVAPPAQAQAPAPKVTITGSIDTYTTAGHNIEESNFHRPGDSLWVTHTRGRFFVTGEVGKAKGVLGLEIDENWGQVGYSDSVTLNTNTIQRSSTAGAFDLGVDTTGIIEIKNLYVEFPVPLVPIPTIIRIGAQPPDATWKGGVLLADDFGGVHLISTFNPAVKWKFTYIQLEENLVGNRPLGASPYCSAAPSASTALTAASPGTTCARGDDFALITSIEYTPMKGLDLRPIYSYLWALGATNAMTRNTAIGGIGGSPGFTVTSAAATPQHQENRHTIGAEAKWVQGPFMVQPTFLYQWGTRDTDTPSYVGLIGTTNRITEADLSAWLFDVEGTYKIGPFLFGVRYLYTSGNRPKDQLHKDVNYYQPITTGGGFWNGWGDMVGPGTVDIFGAQVHAMPGYIGLERYGRQAFAVKGVYSVTPALDVDVVVSPNWTARSIDTDGTKSAYTPGYAPSSGTITCASHGANSTMNPAGAGCNGDESYIGTDLSAKLVWRFAPGLTFKYGVSYLFAGDALDISEVRGGDLVLTKRSAKDAYYTAAAVGFAF